MNKGNQYTIQEAIQAFMKRHNNKDKFNEAKIANEWRDLMGKMIDQHTEKVYVKNNTLFVYLDSAPLKQELSYAKSKIKNMLNESLGTQAIDEVVIK